MKRFTSIAIAGIAALGVSGCKQNAQQERQALQETRTEAMQDVRDAEKQAQQNIAEEQRETAENIQQERRDVAETRQEAQQEIAEAEKDVAEAERSDAENRREEQNDQGVGGTGQDRAEVKSQTYTGTVTDAGDDEFKLRDQAGKELEFKFADNAAITLNGKEVDRKVLHEGAEVRANADLRDGEWYVKSLEVLSSPKQDEQKK